MPYHDGWSIPVECRQERARTGIPVDVALHPDHVSSRKLDGTVVHRSNFVSRSSQNLFDRPCRSLPAAQHSHSSLQTPGLSHFVVPSLVILTEIRGRGSAVSSRSLIASSSARFPSLN